MYNIFLKHLLIRQIVLLIILFVVGLEEGLRILKSIKKELDVPVLSDVHDVTQLEKAAEVLDMLQIPAFLCRQTDLVYGAAMTGKPVNVKKDNSWRLKI